MYFLLLLGLIGLGSPACYPKTGETSIDLTFEPIKSEHYSAVFSPYKVLPLSPPPLTQVDLLAHSLTNVLTGEQLYKTNIKDIKVLKNETCTVYSEGTPLTPSMADDLLDLAQHKFEGSLKLDNIRAIYKSDLDFWAEVEDPGLPLLDDPGRQTFVIDEDYDPEDVLDEYFGFKERINSEPLTVGHLYNHMDIEAFYEDEGDQVCIQMVAVSLKSLKTPACQTPAASSSTVSSSQSAGDFAAIIEAKPPALTINRKMEGNTTVAFSYTLQWVDQTDKPVENGRPWNISRSERISNIMSSIGMTVLLTLVIGYLLVRALRKDISKYNEMIILDDDPDDMLDERGWKLVAGDVFRKPRHSKILSVFIGVGVQLFVVIVLAMCSLGLGGSLRMPILISYCIASVSSGYVSARFYKSWKGEDWKTLTILTATFFPAICIATFGIMNWFFQWFDAHHFNEEAQRMGLGTVIQLISIWLVVIVPLVFIGAFKGFSQSVIELPVRTNQIPRQIPSQHFYYNRWLIALAVALVPFAVTLAEERYFLQTLWHRQYHVLFLCLISIFVVYAIVCCQVAIGVTYFLLSCENYKWHWTSFTASGFSAVYMFGYAILHYFQHHSFSVSQHIHYLIFTGMTCFALFLISGALGFVSSFLFVKCVYASIKID